MGGKILEFKGEKLINQGRAEGRAEGRVEGRAEGKVIELAELARDGVLPVEKAEELAGKKYGISAADFRRMVSGSALMEG